MRRWWASSRAVRVDAPFEESVLQPAHHLIDPSTGAPAFTGIVQVTALAPTGVVAEALAKAAILAGPEGAATWLRHGGLVVCDDGSHRTIPSRLDS